MRISHVTLAGILGFLLCWSEIKSQSNDTTGVFYPQWIGSVYFDGGVPLSNFNDIIDEGGIGIGGELLYNVQYGRPVWAGIGVHSFEFDDYSLAYTEFVDGALVEFDEKTASRAFMAHFIVRFQPELDFFLQPYFQGAVGWHWFFTNSRIEDVEFDEVVSRQNENRDSELGYGMHVGLQVAPPSLPFIRGDVRVGYFRNASVEYMRYNPALGDVNSYPIDFFERRESAVDVLGIHVGVAFIF